jgi:ABC-type glycerol-3-phosphate transport system substrate-binding protein
MFYRTDILEKIGCPVPDTWDDVYAKTLPILKRNNFDMFYTLGYTPLLLQKGGEYYTPDGKYSALDSEAGYEAFLEWVRLYTVYDLTRTGDFFNHFRIGDIPLGMGTFSDFIRLTVGAPELHGRWAIAPLPGVKDPKTGVVNRSMGGGSFTCFILKNHDQSKIDASWSMLEWWMRSGVQTGFGQEIEANIGTEARWVSANEKSFDELPFSLQEKSVIKISRQWYKEVPIFAGSNITARHINNAWTRCVMGNELPRDSLEEAVGGINKDLFKKQYQYGLRDEGERPD